MACLLPQYRHPEASRGAVRRGANYTNGLQTNVVPVGTYTVVITGTATTNTTLVHNTSVNVTVSAGQALANANFTLTNFASMGLLTVPGGAATSGLGLVLDPADGKADQGWTFTYQNNGYYTIKNETNGLFLTDPNGGSGTIQVTQQTATTDGTQLWTLNSLEGGFEVVNANSGCVLDDDDFNIAAGTPVICYPQKDITDGINQTWYIQTTP